MANNILEKIWDAHVVAAEPEGPDVLFIDLQLLHEVTSPQAFAELERHGLAVFDPRRQVATLDHSIPTDQARAAFVDGLAKKQLETLRQNCKKHDIRLLDVGSGYQGIVHVTAPELGLTRPGDTIVCGDSHTSTHGAFGALAFGIGTTQIFHVLATGALLLDRPKTMRVHFVGQPSEYFAAKDAILALIAQIGVKGGTGYLLEYAGEYVRGLSMRERMTLCNMSIECGARAGLVAPDEVTFEYLARTPAGITPQQREAYASLRTDDGAHFDAEVEIDLSGAQPRASWGTTPAQNSEISGRVPQFDEVPASERELLKTSLEYTQLQPGTPLSDVQIQHVFLGSCTNGRLEDLREAAQVLDGQQVHPNVRMFVVPGSEAVAAAAQQEGLVDIFQKAGADVRKPGCSACLAMNGDIIPPGERCASTSNRNFVGRQGPESITHLVSPLSAAVAAITGRLTPPAAFFAKA